LPKIRIYYFQCPACKRKLNITENTDPIDPLQGIKYCPYCGDYWIKNGQNKALDYISKK